MFFPSLQFSTVKLTRIYLFLDDSDDNERTVTEDKQADLSLLSDEGLEVSVILSDNQGSLDIQNDESVVGKLLYSLNLFDLENTIVIVIIVMQF